MTTEWMSLIAQMVLIKQEISEHDKKGLWEYHLPGIAASEDRLRAAEARLGETLDPMYRAFLQHADGWPAFYQTVHLFGTDDLMGSSRFERAAVMLGYLDDEVLRASSLSRDLVLPIAATPSDLDLFVIAGTSAPSPGSVVWFAAREIDRFPNFEEYFLAMMDYNRAELQDVLEASR